MANEVKHRHTATGSTLYFTIRNTAGQYWNTGGTPNFETLTVANWTSYDVALSESPASSYFYVGTFPAISGNMVAGWYFVEIYSGATAISDSLVASYFGYWDGTTFKYWADDVQAWAGTVPSAYSTTRGTAGTALPAAAADAAGGLPISDAGGLDLDAKLANTNEVTAARMAALTDWIDGGRLDLILDIINLSVQYVRTGTAQAGGSATITLDASASSTNNFYSYQPIRILSGTGAGQIGLCISYNGTTKVATMWNSWRTTPDNTSVFVVLGTHGQVDVGTAGGVAFGTAAAVGVWDRDPVNHVSPDTFGGLVQTIESQTDDIGVAGAGLTDLGGMSTTMKAQIESEVDDALGGGTGTALTAIPWNAAWDTEVQSEVQDALDGTLADSVPADGTRPSLSQAAYMLVQLMTESSISGTTLTVRKVDGSTALYTLTLNDATNPTASTRAT